MSILLDFSVRLTELSRTVPDSAREDAKLALLHNLIVAFAAKNLIFSGDNSTGIAHPAPGYARLLRDSSWAPVHRAIVSNSLLMGARAQHDEHPGSVAHFGSVIIPALLAFLDVDPTHSEQSEDGRSFLNSMVLGYQAGAALAETAGPHTTPRGFRPTGIFGPFGGASALGIARNLSSEELAHALAFALSSGSAITQVWRDGSDEWRFQTAYAARAGYESAELASLGARGAIHALEGESGFLRAFAGLETNDLSHVANQVHAGLEADWAISNLLLKPYPVCAINQAAVWRALELIKEHALTPALVKQVEIRLAPRDASYPGVAHSVEPTSWAQAMMSMPHAIATALQERTISYGHLTPPFSPGVNEITSRVALLPDASITGGHAAGVRFYLHDGRTIGDESYVTVPRNWASTEALCQRLLPDHGLSEEAIAELVKTVKELDAPGGPSRMRQLLTDLS